MTRAVTVAAVKKTRHGSYGRQLAVVTVDVLVDADGYASEAFIHARALTEFQALLPTLTITTEIVNLGGAKLRTGK